jgi:hypothetical protein
VCATLSLLDPNFVGVGLRAQERGPEDNGTTFLMMEKRFFNTPNVRSTTDLKDACLRLNPSLLLIGKPSYCHSLRW